MGGLDMLRTINASGIQSMQYLGCREGSNRPDGCRL